jgi:death on curing protein
MDLKTLSIDRVLEIHDEMLNVSGGLPGLAGNKSLEAALHRIDNYIFYHHVNDLYEIAALYGIALAQGHVFNDANKRTAFISMVIFLFTNGLLMVMKEHDAVNLMLQIANKELDRKEVANILKNSCTLRTTA